MSGIELDGNIVLMGKNFESLGYRKKGEETRFETLLRYSDEKEKAAKVLGKILKGVLKEGVDFLDIGTGNGEYLLKSIQYSQVKKSVHFTLIEPSRDLRDELRGVVKKFPKASRINIINKKWEGFSSTKKFDVILVSHSTYSWHRDNWERLFAKMVDYLKPGGYIIFITRRKDDAYRFKQTFRPLFFGKAFKAVELDECLQVFRRIFAKKKLSFSPKVYESHSKLYFPIKEKPEDAISLIEFYLVKGWGKIQKPIQKKIIGFLKRKHCFLRQIDGIAIIRKTG